MSSGRLSQGAGAALLGIEIGRNKVRLALLDPEGKSLDDVVERPIVKGGGPRDPIEEESSTRAAIEGGIERLGLTSRMPLLVGVTIGFPHCGVGSGPALREWLADLSLELGEPIVFVGQHGVSYAPAHCIDFVRRVFEPTHLHIDRLELAPVAASRALESLRSRAVTLGSGVAWSARILDRDVLEAFEIIDGAFDEVLHVVANGVGNPIDHIEGVYVDEMMCRNRGLSVGVMAPAVGVAVALHEPTQSNLLDGQYLSGPTPRQAVRQPRVEVVSQAPAPDHLGAQSLGQAWPTADESLPQPPEVDSRFDDRLDHGNAAAPLADTRFASSRPELGDDLDTTHRLRRLPPEAARSREPVDERLGRSQAAPPATGRQARDDMAGIESFSPQPTLLESPNRFHVSDFLLGALLMLALVLVAALVLA